MSPRSRTYVHFAAIGLLAYVAIGFGVPILAKSTMRGGSVVAVVSEQFENVQSLWTLFELVPFLLVGVVCGSLAHESPRRATGLFVVGFALVAALYLHGIRCF
jgi:hypothetical protein